MSDQPIPQDATGTIVDQRATATADTPPPSMKPGTAPSTAEKATSATTPTEAEPKSLLNQEAPKAPEGAPAQYEAWTVPEGFTIDEPTEAEAASIFKEMGLSQAQGQKL